MLGTCIADSGELALVLGACISDTGGLASVLGACIAVCFVFSFASGGTGTDSTESALTGPDSVGLSIDLEAL